MFDQDHGHFNFSDWAGRKEQREPEGEEVVGEQVRRNERMLVSWSLVGEMNGIFPQQYVL
jgi:hypothetical protein